MEAVIDWGWSRWRKRHEWSAVLSDERGYVETRISHDLNLLLGTLRHEYSITHPEYTPAALQRHGA